MKRLLVTFALFGVLAVGTPMVAAAQTDITGVPDPSECTVEPRSLESFQAALATPAVAATPDALPETPALPEGEPADAETAAAVLETLREGVACINAGEYLRILALYSDNVVREGVGGLGDQVEAVYDELATPAPPTEAERTEIIEVQGVVVPPDGRVAALVVGDDRSDADPASPTLFVFVEQDGRWLIDAFIETPDEGTPVP
jgi:hypothetical protein